MKHIKLFEAYTKHEAPFKDITFNTDAKNDNNEENIKFLRKKYNSICDDVADSEHSLSQVKDMIDSGEMHDYIKFLDNQGEFRRKGVDVVYSTAIERNREDIVDLLYDNGFRVSNVEDVIKWCESGSRCKIQNLSWLVKGLAS